jgi:site-specific DNA recombinase
MSQNLPVDIYCRVSSVGGREHLISPEEQERDARAFASRRGLTVAEVIVDLDASGGTLDRPGLQRALARVKAGQSGGIVVAYLSRLSRETSQGLALLESVRAMGGDVYAPNLSDHTTADGRMLNTIQLAIDAGMRERAKETIARAREQAIERGIPTARRPAVGYMRDPLTRRYVPSPDAPAIREVFSLRAAGAGPAELADFLEATGVKTSQGSPSWTRSSLHGILKSRVYLGEARSGPYVNPTAHEPLVDVTTWEAAQRPNPRPATRGRQGNYILTGVLRCQACGHGMQGTLSAGGRRIYRCLRRHAAGRCPEPSRIDAATVEAAVLAELRGVFLPRPVGPAGPGSDLAGLAETLAAAERRLEQVRSPEAQDAWSDEWPAMVKARVAEREAAAKALAEARGMAGQSAGFWDAFARLDIDNASPEELRRAIGGAFRYVAVARDKTLHWPPDNSNPNSSVELPSRGGRGGLHPLPRTAANLEGLHNGRMD